ncbi:MAG TPA: serine hydrolase domain-containing protein [Phnomibacter sp.]|nr:serine hydrolase domain-containing protein [Phnomibacter sp.]
MKKIIIASSFLFLLNAPCLHAQTASNTQLANAVDSLIATQFKPNEPGISVLIAHKNEIVYKKAFGSAHVELNVPLQPDMIFRVGSITKQFTAIGILQLVEQGKISLQDSIQKYIPGFPSKGHTITIEHLLTHTSGIPDYSNADTMHNPYIERHDFKPQQIIKYFDYMPLEFKPGTKYNYSNSGYVLLAYIIQLVSGQDYHTYMKKNVIDRAGLQHTLFAHEHTIIPNRVEGYTRDRGFFENREYQTSSMAFGCGDLLSTNEDLYQWNKALLAYRLVSKELLQKAFTPFKLNDGSYTKYGYGWFIDSFGIKRIHHAGQVSGFTSMEAYYPGKDVFVSILTNQLSGEDKTDFTDNRFRLFDKIFSLATGERLEKEVVLVEADLDKFIGVYAATVDKKETLTIYKKDGRLYMDLSNKTGRRMWLQPLSATEFILPDVRRVRTTCEFILENGKVTKAFVTQEKKFEWMKIK